MIKNEFCNICAESDWHDLDYLRDQEYWYQKEIRQEDEPVGFKICKKCGFITYDYLVGDRLQKIYEFQRPVVNANNIIIGNRRNNNHAAFLSGLNLKGFNILDVGCAQGNFLLWLVDYYRFDKQYLYGIEFNKNFINFAKNEYGFKIYNNWSGFREEFGEKYFSLISYYHSLEHIQYPEAELLRSREFLKDDGILYISIPTWLDKTDSSTWDNLYQINTISFEELYHLNHVNVFTKQSFQNLLKKCGFEIYKENYTYYGYTILAKKCDPSNNVVVEDFIKSVKIIENEKKAIQLCNEGKHEEALKIISNYPDAYILWSINKDNMKSFEKQIEILNKALEIMPDDFKINMQLAKLLFQWDQNNPQKIRFYSNNIQKSEKIFDKLLGLKPNNEESLYFLGLINGFYKKNFMKCFYFLKRVITINPARWAEIWNLIAKFMNE